MTALLDALIGDPELETLLSDSGQLAHMLAAERALTGAISEAGLVDETAADEALAAITAFSPDWLALRDGMARDGVIVPALVRQLREAAGGGAAAIHFGATSQDILDTALVLTLGRVSTVFDSRLAAILSAISAFDAGHPGATLMARTRTQPALKLSLSEKLRTWREPLERTRGELAVSVKALSIAQLGGPVGDRHAFGEHAELIAQAFAARLGLGYAPSWHSARDRIARLGTSLALVTGTLGKIGADIAILAQPELEAFRLSAGGGSSSMPHKSNPVGAEVLVALAHYNAGLSGTLQHAMIHENERSGAAWTLEWLALPGMLRTTGGALLLAERVLRSVLLAGIPGETD